MRGKQQGQKAGVATARLMLTCCAFVLCCCAAVQARGDDSESEWEEDDSDFASYKLEHQASMGASEGMQSNGGAEPQGEQPKTVVHS
jgi:hypothetical protein